MNFRKAIKRKVDLSQEAFQIYLENRTFASALVLKDINNEACKLIGKHAGCFDDDEWAVLSRLIIHWKGWLQQFDVEQINRLPQLNDEFIFERAKGLTAWPQNINDVIKHW